MQLDYTLHYDHRLHKLKA